MKNNTKLELSLRITHPSIDPDKISTILNLKPSVTHRVGENRKTPKGRQLDGVYTHTYWNYKLPNDSIESLSNLIDSMNQRLVENKKFLVDLVEAGGEIEYFIGCFSPFNIGDTLDWRLLEQCVQLRVNLSLDIYGSL